MGRNVRYRALLALVASLFGVAVACGSGNSAPVDAGGAEGRDASATLQTVTDAGGGGTDAEEAVDGVASDAPTAAEASRSETDAGSFACGTTACNSSQLCVHPCCGGAAPSCMPVPSLGGCPSNLVMVSACPGTGRPGCQNPPCTPNPPFCIDGASQCANACACTGNGCAECQSTTGNDILCRCG
jgi:hypothetical protein